MDNKQKSEQLEAQINILYMSLGEFGNSLPEIEGESLVSTVTASVKYKIEELYNELETQLEHLKR